ncbi:MAG: hypothetical protein OXB86_05385 [Bdellovibrionales bacterium]|nr:hypothetical protein [Bdellovibrionales bacterium]
MNRVFKFSALIPLLYFLPGCNPPAPEPLTSGSASTKTDASSKKDSLFQTANKNHGSSGPCSGNSDCKEICDIIYKYQPDKDKCVQRLPVKQVELLEEAYAILKNPHRNDLNKLPPETLLVLLGITVEPVVTLINRGSQIQVKELLIWLAENKTFSEIFRNADKKFKILKELLIKLHTDPHQALSASLYKGSNFIEMAVKKNNNSAVDWVHDFFDKECDAVTNYTECLFKDHYCHLKLNPRTENYYFGYDPFLELLKDTLETAKPSSAPLWWNENVDIDNVDSWLDDPHNICKAAEFE